MSKSRIVGNVMLGGGGGGAGGAVDSVDGRTGNVTLGDKYVNVSGDSMTGPLAVSARTTAQQEIATGLNVQATTAGYAGAAVAIQAETHVDAAYSTAFGVLIKTPVIGEMGELGASVGLEIESQGSPTVEPAYAIRQFGANDRVSFNGLVEANRGIQLGPEATYPTFTIGLDMPEGEVTAAPGSLYSCVNEGAEARLYVKDNGSEAYGWLPLSGGGSGGDYVAITGDTMTGALKLGTPQIVPTMVEPRSESDGLTDNIILDPIGRVGIFTGGTIPDPTSLLTVGAYGLGQMNEANSAVGVNTQVLNWGVGQVFGLMSSAVAQGPTSNGLIGIATSGWYDSPIGTMASYTGVLVSGASVQYGGSATITDSIGVEIHTQKKEGVVNGYGIRQLGTDDVNHFAGVVQGLKGFRHGDDTYPSWTSGAGSPEGAVTAVVGSMYSRRDGATDTAVYRKETGTSTTGWVALSAAGGGGGAVASVDGRTGAVTLGDLYVNATTDNMTGNLGLGVPTPLAKLHLAAGTTEAGGIRFGTDCSIYRTAAGSPGYLYVNARLSADILDMSAGSTTLQLAKSKQGTTSTTAYTGGAAVTLQNTMATVNNWTYLAFENSLGTQIGGIACKNTNQTSSYGELWFHSKSAASSTNMYPRLRLPETGGAVIYGDGGTAVLTVSNTGDLTPATAGMRIGTAAANKLGFYGAAAIVQPAGWAVTVGYTATKTFNPESTTLTEAARVLGTLIDQLKTLGLVGA